MRMLFEQSVSMQSWESGIIDLTDIKQPTTIFTRNNPATLMKHEMLSTVHAGLGKPNTSKPLVEISSYIHSHNLRRCSILFRGIGTKEGKFGGVIP